MPRAEDEALAAVMQPPGSHDIDAYLAEYQQRLTERHKRLRTESRRMSAGSACGAGDQDDAVLSSQPRVQTPIHASHLALTYDWDKVDQ
jgi:hypothetical protein